MKKRKIIRILLYIAVIFWMITIFSLSNMKRDNSEATSKGLLYKIVSITTNDKDRINETVEKYNIVIRKCAHITEYLILSLLVYLALIYSDVDKNKSMIFTLIICILYAISDEIHQLFVPGRGGQIKDVFIDSIGIIISIFFINIRNKSQKQAKICLK